MHWVKTVRENAKNFSIWHFRGGNWRIFGIGLGASTSGESGAYANGPTLYRFARRYTGLLDSRFQGGYITRHYGQPQDNIHAVQLEMTRCSYMQEAMSFD